MKARILTIFGGLIISGLLIYNNHIIIAGLILIAVSLFIAASSVKNERDWMNAPMMTHNKIFKKLQNYIFMTSFFGGVGLLIYGLIIIFI